MATDDPSPFAHGSAWVRADFHLHTKADKEFKYDGDENAFVGAYVDALKKAGIGLAVITNHNKFDAKRTARSHDCLKLGRSLPDCMQADSRTRKH